MRSMGSSKSKLSDEGPWILRVELAECAADQRPLNDAVRRRRAAGRAVDDDPRYPGLRGRDGGKRCCGERRGNRGHATKCAWKLRGHGISSLWHPVVMA